ncbi:MAG: neutral/alkaline non-lysosomal ceramidase N-terminal domain-containing protein [Cyclobacteriaceae bacterium]
MGEKLSNIGKKVLKIIWIPILLGFSLFTSVDDKDYKTADFYNTTLGRLDSLKQVFNRQDPGSILVGWGKANITPPEPVRLTGKNWDVYNEVLDSVYVRAFIFSNTAQKIALLSYDLWIMHPHLTEAIKEKIASSNLGITGIYFTANHSHTSIGGWATGLLGALAIGGNHPERITFLEDRTLEALQLANANLKPSLTGFSEVRAKNMVSNRLDPNAPVDDKLRFLQFQNDSKELAIFATFSAHSIFMVKGLNALSADYPGPLIATLESSDSVDFACFAPGATGSHTPVGRKPFEYSKMEAYGQVLAARLLSKQQKIVLDTTEILKYAEWPVDLRSPHFRVSNHWRFRPWAFNSAMGNHSATITALRVGNTVLIGLPVELSGEFSTEFEDVCKSKGLSLMVTSFNGNYMGYVNPEKYYYTLNKPETRDMNWYGPQNGEYFVDLIKELLAII